jgi:uncharacterized protein (TIGR03067 family)
MPLSTTVPLPSSDASAREDLDRLQGAWTFMSGRHPIDLLIAGRSFTVKFKNGPLYMGTFRIDPGQEPRNMDMLVTEGPERHRWKTALCIYEFEGDYLRWCAREPGHKDRLEVFPPEGHLAYYCTLFKRDRG